MHQQKCAFWILEESIAARAWVECMGGGPRRVDGGVEASIARGLELEGLGASLVKKTVSVHTSGPHGDSETR
jgi:hypothetical protein